MSNLKAIFETDDYDHAIEYARFVSKKTERETTVRRSGETWQGRDIWHVFVTDEVAKYFEKNRDFTPKEQKSTIWGPYHEGTGWDQCQRCHGSGQLEDMQGFYDCPDCTGSGSIEVGGGDDSKN